MSDQNDPASLATVTYTPFGAVSTLLNGCADGSGSSCTNIQESYFYNTRLQMAVAELGTSSTHAADSCRVYSYYVGAVPSACSESSSAWPTGSNNNGNVAGYYYTDDVNTLSHTASYTYDGATRLGSAAASGSVAYSQSFSYDNYGNMSCSASPAETNCLQTTYNTPLNNNQISNYSYDAAGNLLNDGTYSYQWDAEGRLTAVTLSGNVVSMNTHNALGQRVEDVTQSSTTEEAYGADGALLARYTGDSNSRSFVPFNGRILAEYYCGGVIFDHPDELGSATTATDCTGKNVQERLYYPFGEFWNGAGSLGMHQMFAQLPDYDPETDQYNTPNRHYTPMGRWLSPDPLGGDVTNPQSLNRYAYVLNNSTSLIDPLGLLYTSRYACVNAWSMCAGAASPWAGGEDGLLDIETWQTVATGWSDDPSWETELVDEYAFIPNATSWFTDYSNAPTGPLAILPLPSPPPILRSLAPGCLLEAPSGDYTVASNRVVAMFAPAMADVLTSAIGILNSQGIVPMITSGFRTAAQQAALQGSPYGAAQVSWHQVGMAADIIGNAANLQAIITAMTGSGLTWGGTFIRPDPVHFQNAPGGTTPSAAQLGACSSMSP